MTWRPPRISPSSWMREGSVIFETLRRCPCGQPACASSCAAGFARGRLDRRPRSLLLPLSEQAELRGIARRLGEAEMAEGVRGEQPPTRGALDKTLLDQERLDDLLDRVARLGERRRDGLDPDRPAAVIH